MSAIWSAGDNERNRRMTSRDSERFLCERALVYGGQISFALYMVHELVHTSWNWAAIQFEIVLDEGAIAAKWMVIGLLVAATAFSMLLFHGVEEPARR